MLPIIFGLQGFSVNDAERAFFHACNPFGFILFRRNIDTPEQVKTLVAELRAIVGRDDAPILIDQEGGRVQRLRPPHWVDLPNAQSIGALYDKNPVAGLKASALQARVISGMLTELGIDVDCAPVMDLPVQGAHDVIGDRAFANDADAVIDLSVAMGQAFLAHGVMPIMKHIPGHGRAMSDSHYECPVVHDDMATLEQTDFSIFKQAAAKIGAEKLWSMTAHVVFTALDDAPVSVSKKAIDYLRHDLGISGPIIPDAIEMEALGGTLAERAIATLNAGCDAVLHCSGNLDDMQSIAAQLPQMTHTSRMRFEQAAAARAATSTIDWRADYAALAAMLDIKIADDYQSHEALTIA